MRTVASAKPFCSMCLQTLYHFNELGLSKRIIASPRPGLGLKIMALHVFYVVRLPGLAPHCANG